MKRILLSAFGLAVAGIAMAQVKEGTIVYERKMNVHRRIKDEQMKAMIPEFRTDKQQLVFNDSITVYKAVPDDTSPDPFAGGRGGGFGGPGGGGPGGPGGPGGGPGGGQRMGPPPGMGGQNKILYINLNSQLITEQTELGDKTYLIKDTLQQQPWKLTDESKEVLKYTCKKATMTNAADQNIIAWYTEAIAIPAGPELFNGLPGLVLQLDINDGETVFTAQELSQDTDKKVFKAPSKGKAISRAEYDEKMQELFKNRGGGRGM